MIFRPLLSAILILAAVCTSAWSAPLTTYVAPFAVSGAAKPDEMKSTLQALLLSRLAGDKIATVATPEGADITVTGSYLQSGSFFSLDAAATTRAGVVIVRAFSQGKSPEELIPGAGSVAKALSAGIEKGFVATAATTALPASTFTPTPGLVKPAPTVSASGQTILKLDGALSGIALGRTLPNGERELFIVGDHYLRYYRQGAGLKLVAEIPYRIYEKVLAVDTAALDGDTIPEIYVTVMDGEKLVSQVWTVDGTALKKIAGPLPYYFRSVTGSGGVKKLYAQQITGKADFSGDVSEVVKKDGAYALGAPVKLPKPGYLYNFNFFKDAKGETDAILFDQNGNLRVYNPAGDDIWKSGDGYGGSETFFTRSDPESVRGDGIRQVFLDKRIIVMPDGELLVPKNFSSWYILDKHAFGHSSLFCFAWNGTDLVEKWHTNQTDYYMSDFVYDVSSRELLLLEVVTKEGGAFSRGASRLVIKKLEQ
jgi:hypothetical protein